MIQDMGASSDEDRAATPSESSLLHVSGKAGIPCAKVMRDGKVAVLVSGGFGAGWYSWKRNPALLFDPALVSAVEAGDEGAVLRRAEEIEPGGYFGGASGLHIVWVPQGAIFRIDEYDGSEGLVIQSSDDWIVA